MRATVNARTTLLAGFTTVRDVGTYRAFTDVALRDAINDGTVPGFDNDKLREMFRPRGSAGGMGGLRRFGPGGAGGGFTGGGFDGPTSPN